MPNSAASNTQGLIDVSTRIMAKRGVQIGQIWAVDQDIATGVWPKRTTTPPTAVPRS
jgi:hypothetical protein